MAAENAATAINLFPFILFLVFFLLGVVFVVIVIQIVVFVEIVVLVVLFGRQFKGRNASHVQIGAALLAGQRVAFIQVLFVDVDRCVTFWTVDHLLRILPPAPACRPVRRAGIRSAERDFSLYLPRRKWQESYTVCEIPAERSKSPGGRVTNVFSRSSPDSII